MRARAAPYSAGMLNHPTPRGLMFAHPHTTLRAAAFAAVAAAGTQTAEHRKRIGLRVRVGTQGQAQGEAQ